MLQQMRAAIQRAAPGAYEAIKYGVPTFIQGGILVHFAAFKNHIGFYPTPSGIQAFREQLAPYKSSKGSVQFALNRPLPTDLIEQIVRFRVIEVCGRSLPQRRS